MDAVNQQACIVIRPHLVLIPDHTGEACHFRGGDNEILPLKEVADPELMSDVIRLLKYQVFVRISDLHQAFPSSIASLTEILTVLTDAGITFVSESIDPENSLHRKLIREGVFSKQTLSDIGSKSILLVSDDEFFCRQVDEHCQRMQLNLVVQASIPQPDKVFDFMIVQGDFSSHVLFESANQYALHNEIPWLLIRKSGLDQAQLGPLFVPGDTGCFECLEQRMRSQRRELAYYHQLQKNCIGKPEYLWSPHDQAFITGRVLDEVINYFVFKTKLTLVNYSLYIDLVTMEIEKETLLRLPGCSACDIPTTGMK